MSLCQKPWVKDSWHVNSVMVFDHYQNSTSGSNHSSQTSGILKLKKLRKYLLSASLTSLLFLNSGCAVVKYGPDLLSGERRILRNSQPIEEVLKEESIDKKIKSKLLLVQEAKQFAVQELGLKPTKNYEKVNLIDSAPILLLASPKDKLELKKTNWLFFESSYLPFFDIKDALKEKKSLEEKGYDVFMTEILAYSTLGWFQEPILKNMLEENETELSNAVFHETTHNTLHNLKNIGFTEGIASFIGNQGAREFIVKKYGENSPQYKNAEDAKLDSQLFSEFINNLYYELDELYKSELSKEEKLKKREEIFSSSKIEFEELKKQLKTGLYLESIETKLNNAYVLSHLLYREDYGLYDKIYNSENRDMKKTLELFKQASKQKVPDEFLKEYLGKR